MLQNYIDVLTKKYVQFNGRATRYEFWSFTLFNILASLLVGTIDGLLGMPGALTGLYALAVLLPGLALVIRRLHDTGKSGWWMLASFIPLIGIFIMLYFFIKGSDEGANKFGPAT